MKKQVSLTAMVLATAMSASVAQAGDVEVSGKVFFDYSVHSNTSGGVTDKTVGGNASRTYLTAKKKIDNTWSAKVTFDSAYDKNATGKSNNVFLKTAQLTGKFSDIVNVKLGLIGTPWVGYEDKLGKHRHVSKSYVDTHKMDSSADTGVGVFGKVGMVSYDIVSVNGGGYGDTKVTDKNDINARIGVAPIKGLTVDLGYRDGYKGTKFTGSGAVKKSTLTQFLVTYGKEINDLSYRAGLNIINNKVDNKTAVTSATEKGQELWIWARKGDFGAYLRNENTDWDQVGSDKEKRTVVSLDYYAAKDVVISLVSDSSTGLKGVNGDDKSTTGVFTQFTF